MSIRYISHLSEITSDLKQAKARSLEIIGGTAEGHAKDNLVKNGSVQSGTLLGSVAHEPISEDTEEIGTDVKYAPYVELGHNQQPGRYVPAIGKRLVASHVAAKPFLKPALNHGDEYLNIVKSEYGIK